MMRAKGRILSLLLVFCLVAGLLPTVTFAAGTDTGKAIQIDASGISGYDSTNGYDYIYYGTWSSRPIKWRVLDTKTNMEKATEGDGLFLLSDVLLGTGPYGGVYFQRYYHEDSSRSTYHKGSAPSDGNHTNCRIMNAWQDSDAQGWCSEFYSDNLTTQEQSAVLETTKSDKVFNSSTYRVSFAASENILSGDKVFFLSTKEAETRDYGFTDDAARIANYDNSASGWWLRSPCADDTYVAGAVCEPGSVLGLARDDWAARPAFNLNLRSVLFTSAAEGGKISAAASGGNQGGEAAGAIFEIGDYTGSEWKLTLLDASRNNFSISSTPVNDGKISFSYSGAQTGTNEYISVVVVDNGAITHYGRILQLDGTTNSESGTASLSLPAGVTLSKNTKLYVFNEQYNGGANDDTKLTDYASQLIDVQSSVAKIVQKGLTEVPEGLKNTGFDTVEKIEDELTRILTAASGYTTANTEVYDLKLQISTDGGKTWIAATADNFPASGITAVIPYPSGTGKTTHDFTVTHMFTVTSPVLGTTVGQTEQPTVTKTDEGIRVTLKGLSPVGIAWKTISSAGSGGGGGGGGAAPATPQKPEIKPVTGGKVSLSADGTTATITPDAGKVVDKVLVNGKDMGAVTELKGLKTGDKIEVLFKDEVKEPSKAETDKQVKAHMQKLAPKARSLKTKAGNVKVSFEGQFKDIEALGYTVKYKFYRSTKKASGYKYRLTTSKPSYTNTGGKKGTLYYYKAIALAYDKDGKLIAKTELKQCRYACRRWSK